MSKAGKQLIEAAEEALAVAQGKQGAHRVIPGDNAELPEHWRWKGDGPAPAKWTAADGTLVYRSYTDYCMD